MEEVIDNDLNTLDVNAPIITKDKAIFKFTKLTRDELGGKFETFLLKKGYKLEDGNQLKGKYGKGSKVMRVLFGAFVKRFAWEVTIESDGTNTQLTFFKETKGYAGGMVGVKQVKNEFTSITESLMKFHTKQELES